MQLPHRRRDFWLVDCQTSDDRSGSSLLHTLLKLNRFWMTYISFFFIHLTFRSGFWFMLPWNCGHYLAGKSNHGHVVASWQKQPDFDLNEPAASWNPWFHVYEQNCQGIQKRNTPVLHTFLVISVPNSLIALICVWSDHSNLSQLKHLQHLTN